MNLGIDLEFVKNNISKYSSKKLCEIIICDRYFKINNELSILCMEELAKRRGNGDDFKFEEYIDSSYKELPTLDFSIPDFSNVLEQLRNRFL